MRCNWFMVRQIHETSFDVRVVTILAVDEYAAERQANKDGWHTTRVTFDEPEFDWYGRPIKPEGAQDAS